MRPVKPEAAALTFISGWETVALTTRAVPPWTHLLLRLPRPARAVVVGLVAGWLTVHLHVWRPSWTR